MVPLELGVDVPIVGMGGYSWRRFLANCELKDVLDLVTVADRFLGNRNLVRKRELWRRDVQRIFREENVRYRLDDRGGVHFYIDEEFARATAATIAVLQGTRSQGYRSVINAAAYGTFEADVIATEIRAAEKAAMASSGRE